MSSGNLVGMVVGSEEEEGGEGKCKSEHKFQKNRQPSVLRGNKTKVEQMFNKEWKIYNLRKGCNSPINEIIKSLFLWHDLYTLILYSTHKCLLVTRENTT